MSTPDSSTPDLIPTAPSAPRRRGTRPSRGGRVVTGLGLLTVAVVGSLMVTWNVRTQAPSTQPHASVADVVVEEPAERKRIRIEWIHFDVPEEGPEPPESKSARTRRAPAAPPGVASEVPSAPRTEPLAGTAEPADAIVLPPPVVVTRDSSPSGTLFVSSRPLSRVQIDGEAVGLSNNKYPLAEGLHQVALLAPDGRETELAVIVESGDTTRLCWDFESADRCTIRTHLQAWQ